MKPTSNPKTSSLSRESQPAVARPAVKSSSAAFSGSASQGRSGKRATKVVPASSSRSSSETPRPQSTSRAGEANGQQKASRRTHPSSTASSASMDAIRSDRGTTIALYTLFGAVLAGVIYFIALMFLM